MLEGQLEAVLAQVEANLVTIFTQIRSVYSGTVVVLDYYALTYQTPIVAGESELLNGVINTVAATFTVIPATGFAAFAKASASTTGSPCKAGLLIPVPSTGETPTGHCNVHPTRYGQQVLAAADLAALTKRR